VSSSWQMSSVLVFSSKLPKVLDWGQKSLIKFEIFLDRFLKDLDSFSLEFKDFLGLLLFDPKI